MLKRWLSDLSWPGRVCLVMAVLTAAYMAVLLITGATVRPAIWVSLSVSLLVFLANLYMAVVSPR